MKANYIYFIEHELRAELPALVQDEQVWVNLPVAVNADSLATWFSRAMTEFAAQAPVLLQLSVDDEGHTAQWLRSGSVLAAVTANEQPASAGRWGRCAIWRPPARPLLSVTSRRVSMPPA